MDFHHQLKGAILDAVDEGLIERDPTRKVIIKGKTPSRKKIKYLNQFELHSLLSDLHLGKEADWDYFILLIAKTGMRFSEALALTPKDFDFSHQTLSIRRRRIYAHKEQVIRPKDPDRLANGHAVCGAHEESAAGRADLCEEGQWRRL